MRVDIDKLEALERAATPGPWEVEGRGDAWIAAPHPKLGSVPVVVPHVMQVAADLDFIAEARNAFPELVREVRELRGIAEAKDAAYRERDALVALLSKLFPATLGHHGDDPDWDDDWRNIVYIDFPTGQGSWHIHDRELPMFAHLSRGTAEWDGHTTEEKYARLAEYDKEEPKTLDSLEETP